MRVDPTYVNNLVRALDHAQTTSQKLSAEMSSGVRVNALSDDPLASGQNVLLLNQMQQDDTFIQSADLVTGQLQVADSALGQVVSQLTQALSLATSANNGTMNASNRLSVANQLAGIRAEILGLANSDYQGQYIFSGGVTTAAPFSLNTSGSPAVVTYNGDGDVNFLQAPNGQRIQMNLPGDQIFLGPMGSSVFVALNNLIADYSASTVNTAQAVKDTQSLSSAINYVSQQRVSLDNSITQLGAASTASSAEKAQLTAAQTHLMQADVASIATQLSLSQTQQSALESIIARLGSDSLFDHLR